MKPAWRVFGASVQGTAHVRAGTPCQDAHDCRVLPDGTVLVTVADGAGSAEHSAAGAGLAVSTALAVLRESLVLGWPATEPDWRQVFGDVFEQARLAIERQAEAEGRPPRAFATTLLAAALSEHGLALGQVGDGVAVARLHGGDWLLAAGPQRGEYANETYFLTQPGALEHLNVRVVPERVEALAAMSDGLLRLVLDLGRNQPHVPFFDPLLAFAAEVADEAAGADQLGAFLASDRVCARTDDDKTLVLAVRVPLAETAPSTSA